MAAAQCGACFNRLCKQHPNQDSGASLALLQQSAASGRGAMSKLYDDLIAKRLVKARMESAAARADEEYNVRGGV